MGRLEGQYALGQPLRRDLAVAFIDICYTATMRTKAVRICAQCACKYHPQAGRTEQAFCSRRCYLEKRWGARDPGQCAHCCKALKLGSRTRRFCGVACRVAAQVGRVGLRGVIPYGKGGAYLALRQPHHPCADSKGYIMEHRLVMESIIGRFLLPTEIVHHIDENPRNNNPSNLQVMTAAEHTAHHHRGKAKRRTAKRPD